MIHMGTFSVWMPGIQLMSYVGTKYNVWDDLARSDSLLSFAWAPLLCNHPPWCCCEALRTITVIEWKNPHLSTAQHLSTYLRQVSKSLLRYLWLHFISALFVWDWGRSVTSKIDSSVQSGVGQRSWVVIIIHTEWAGGLFVCSCRANLQFSDKIHLHQRWRPFCCRALCS